MSALSYLWRLMSWSRWTWPSTWSWLHGSLRASRTASMSRSSPVAKPARAVLCAASSHAAFAEHAEEALGELCDSADPG